MFPFLFLAIPPPPNTDVSAPPSRQDQNSDNQSIGMSYRHIFAIASLVWYSFVTIICLIGRWRMFVPILFLTLSPIPPSPPWRSLTPAPTVIRLRTHSTKPSSTSNRPKSPSSTLPFVSILRPIKGTDPYLSSCLTSTCHLSYPHDRYELLLCVASPSDPAVPAIQSLIASHPNVNIRLFTDEEDIGPNPKIRNLNTAYREARGDIVWILDCNIWVPPNILSNSVAKLEKFKLVHHLPIVVDVDGRAPTSSRCSTPDGDNTPVFGSTYPAWRNFGGRLEENFMSSSHAKMYSAINTIAIASCVVGKSTLFRRSHLADITSGAGLSFFADYICEDHMITDRIWRYPLTEERQGVRRWGKHHLGEDVVFQPVVGMSVADYIDRRTRWLRVRKYTLLAAALVEPLTESILASALLAFAAVDLECGKTVIGDSWRAFMGVWLASMVYWAAVDYSIYNVIHSYRSTAVDDNSPDFLLRPRSRGFGAWLAQWVGREMLAPVVWCWGMWPGYVEWRGGLYKIRWSDLKVEEVKRAGLAGGSSRPSSSARVAAAFVAKKD